VPVLYYLELIYKDLTRGPGLLDDTGEFGLSLVIQYLRQRELAVKQHLNEIRTDMAA